MRIDKFPEDLRCEVGYLIFSVGGTLVFLFAIKAFCCTLPSLQGRKTKFRNIFSWIAVISALGTFAAGGALMFLTMDDMHTFDQLNGHFQNVTTWINSTANCTQSIVEHCGKSTVAGIAAEDYYKDLQHVQPLPGYALVEVSKFHDDVLRSLAAAGVVAVAMLSGFLFCGNTACTSMLLFFSLPLVLVIWAATSVCPCLSTMLTRPCKKHSTNTSALWSYSETFNYLGNCDMADNAPNSYQNWQKTLDTSVCFAPSSACTANIFPGCEYRQPSMYIDTWCKTKEYSWSYVFPFVFVLCFFVTIFMISAILLSAYPAFSKVGAEENSVRTSQTASPQRNNRVRKKKTRQRRSVEQTENIETSSSGEDFDFDAMPASRTKTKNKFKRKQLNYHNSVSNV